MWKNIFYRKTCYKYFFGQLKNVEQVSYIELKSEREAEIEFCFTCDVDFHYPKGLEKLNLLEDFKGHSKTPKAIHPCSSDEEDIVNSVKSAKRDQLISMDNVPGLADESKKFASLLIVAHKLNYTCVYIFHTIYPEKSI